MLCVLKAVAIALDKTGLSNCLADINVVSRVRNFCIICSFGLKLQVVCIECCAKCQRLAHFDYLCAYFGLLVVFPEPFSIKYCKRQPLWHSRMHV